jgi:hypothetical protein
MGATNEMKGIQMEEELFRYSLLVKFPEVLFVQSS